MADSADCVVVLEPCHERIRVRAGWVPRGKKSMRLLEALVSGRGSVAGPHGLLLERTPGASDEPKVVCVGTESELIERCASYPAEQKRFVSLNVVGKRVLGALNGPINAVVRCDDAASGDDSKGPGRLELSPECVLKVTCRYLAGIARNHLYSRRGARRITGPVRVLVGVSLPVTAIPSFRRGACMVAIRQGVNRGFENDKSKKAGAVSVGRRGRGRGRGRGRKRGRGRPRKRPIDPVPSPSRPCINFQPETVFLSQEELAATAIAEKLNIDNTYRAVSGGLIKGPAALRHATVAVIDTSELSCSLSLLHVRPGREEEPDTVVTSCVVPAVQLGGCHGASDDDAFADQFMAQSSIAQGMAAKPEAAASLRLALEVAFAARKESDLLPAWRSCACSADGMRQPSLQLRVTSGLSSALRKSRLTRARLAAPSAKFPVSLSREGDPVSVAIPRAFMAEGPQARCDATAQAALQVLHVAMPLLNRRRHRRGRPPLFSPIALIVRGTGNVWGVRSALEKRLASSPLSNYAAVLRCQGDDDADDGTDGEIGSMALRSLLESADSVERSWELQGDICVPCVLGSPAGGYYVLFHHGALANNSGQTMCVVSGLGGARVPVLCGGYSVSGSTGQRQLPIVNGEETPALPTRRRMGGVRYRWSRGGVADTPTNIASRHGPNVMAVLEEAKASYNETMAEENEPEGLPLPHGSRYSAGGEQGPAAAPTADVKCAVPPPRASPIRATPQQVRVDAFIEARGIAPPRLRMTFDFSDGSSARRLHWVPALRIIPCGFRDYSSLVDSAEKYGLPPWLSLSREQVLARAADAEAEAKAFSQRSAQAADAAAEGKVGRRGRNKKNLKSGKRQKKKKKGKRNKDETLSSLSGDSSSSSSSSEDTVQWRRSGHKWIGMRCFVYYDDKPVSARVTKWLPAAPGGGAASAALWHVVHEDGDEEDLTEAETGEAIEAWETHKRLRVGLRVEFCNLRTDWQAGVIIKRWKTFFGLRPDKKPNKKLVYVDARNIRYPPLNAVKKSHEPRGSRKRKAQKSVAKPSVPVSPPKTARGRDNPSPSPPRKRSRIGPNGPPAPQGVSFHSRDKSWRASWYKDGKRFYKNFQISRYGEERARQLAILTRRRAEAQGASTSPRARLVGRRDWGAAAKPASPSKSPRATRSPVRRRPRASAKSTPNRTPTRRRVARDAPRTRSSGRATHSTGIH